MDKSLILNEIKKHLNLRYDKEFADFLGIKTTTLAMWYKRNTYDIELIFKKCEFLSAEWLLTGQGSMLKSELVQVASEMEQVYKELAESRLDVIRGLKLEISILEEKISELRYTRPETFLHANVAESAPELTDKKRK